jgi:hypothetical protein
MNGGNFRDQLSAVTPQGLCSMGLGGMWKYIAPCTPDCNTTSLFKGTASGLVGAPTRNFVSSFQHRLACGRLT